MYVWTGFMTRVSSRESVAKLQKKFGKKAEKTIPASNEPRHDHSNVFFNWN